MGNATSELTNSLHLLRLTKLFFQKLLFGEVSKNSDDALLSGNLDDLSRIQSRASFTRLGKKSNFQAANRALFLEDLEKSGAIFGRLPKFQLQGSATNDRSEEHTSELQSRLHLVCRLLLEKKKIHSVLYDHYR